MKYLRQSAIIFALYFLGLIIQKLFKLPIPGNVIGMILLFLGLSSKIIKLHMIENVSDFLLDHLAFFFIPAGVQLITSLDILKGSIFGIFMVSLISTILVLITTGLTVQFLKGGKAHE
jgi:holin-like protein